MEKARLRALTHLPLISLYSFLYGRNGKSPTKGIDTLRRAFLAVPQESVEMEKARLRALTRN